MIDNHPYRYLVHITREDSIICEVCVLPSSLKRKTGKKQTNNGLQCKRLYYHASAGDETGSGKVRCRQAGVGGRQLSES